MHRYTAAERQLVRTLCATHSDSYIAARLTLLTGELVTPKAITRLRQKMGLWKEGGGTPPGGSLPLRE